MADTLTIASLNTWKCDGDYASRVPAMARAVAEAEPDIVFLQEVLRAPGAEDADTSRDIAAACGLKVFDTKARKRRRNVMGRRVQSWSGMSILSRWPLNRLDVVELPTNIKHDRERICQVAGLESPLGPLTLANVHLTHNPKDEDMRAEEMRVLLRHLEVSGTDRVLIAGDFNDVPGSPAVREPFDLNGWRCTDLIIAASGGRFTTFPETDSVIDHALLLQRDGHNALTAVEAGSVGDRPDPTSGVMPSDHVGLRVVLSG